MANYPYVPESTTVIEYPKSKRRKVSQDLNRQLLNEECSQEII
jgi:hypothetical protein